MVQHIRNIFNLDCERRECLYIVQVINVQLRPWIMLKGLSMVINFAQLGAPNACKGLTWGPSNKHIKCLGSRPKPKLSNKLIWFCFSDIAGFRMDRITIMEIMAMRSSGIGIKFHGCCHRKTCGRESERYPSAPSK